MVDIFLVILAIGFVVFLFFEIKDNKRRVEKYIEESNVRIEFFKSNNRLTDEIENLWTAIAYDKYGIYMNEEVGKMAAELNAQEKKEC